MGRGLCGLPSKRLSLDSVDLSINALGLSLSHCLIKGLFGLIQGGFRLIAEPLSCSVWTVDLAHLLRKFGLEVKYTTLTLGTNPGYAEEAFYGHMQEDSVRVEHLFQVKNHLRDPNSLTEYFASE